MFMLTILIVEDSETEALMLKQIFQSAKDMRVVGFAKNGKEAVELTAALHPDVITMDIRMPIMDGLQAINLIMSQNPTPIVVISSTLNNKEMQTTFTALQAGALTVLEKPVNIVSPAFETAKKHIIDTVRSMAEIKVIKRRFLTRKAKKKSLLPAVHTNAYEVIAIGTSVGGPQALIKVLSGLPTHFSLPIVVVQHMTVGFINGFAKWLNDNTSLKVKIAENRELLQGGVVYFAPDKCHLAVDRAQGKLITSLIHSEAVSVFCPSVTVLLKSVAKTCHSNAIGILLTGMGYDGAEGLLAMKKANAHTLIQDPESTIVFGMAGVAQSLGAVDRVIELDSMAEYLIKAVDKNSL